MTTKKNVEKESVSGANSNIKEKGKNTGKNEVKDKNSLENSDKNAKKNQAKSKSTSKSKQSKEKETLKAVEDKNRELQDKYLRLSAEFDNYRKRTLNEKMELTKYASEEVLKDLIPIIDDFQRALSHVDEAKDIDAVKQGLELINNKFKGFLNQKGLKEIDAMHQDFNMDLHEAVTKIPAPNKELKGKIVDVIEKGYTLNEKVVRYSKVVIGE